MQVNDSRRRITPRRVLRGARLAVSDPKSALRRAADHFASPPDSPVGFPITLDYPVTVDARWGYGRPSHPQLESLIATGHDQYRSLLEGFRSYLPRLLAIPVEGDTPGEPTWSNGWFQGLDAATLYGLLASRNPARYVEVGSGWSTTFTRRAIRDHGLRTQVISIDPAPRADVDGLCDRVIRQPLEQADLSVFDELEAGDICFFDGSHYCLPNSDVTVAFLEVLPRLRPGVLVHFHDTFLPWDYLPFFYRRNYSEQYLLAAMLLAGTRLDVVLPNFYVTRHPSLHQILGELWTELISYGANVNGFSFWVELREPLG
ncbi:MAG: class I SAM-dependent methyltransferase [Acidimicrobiales bacterium]